MTMTDGQGNNKLNSSHLEDLHQFQWPKFVCGWGAAFVSISATFPINKVMFRQMLHNSTTRIAMLELWNEGFPRIYRGLTAPLLQKTTSMSLMFGLYYEFQRQLQKYYPTLSTPANTIIAGMLAGTVESILTPFERVQALMQDKNYHKTFKHTFHAFRELQKYGIAEFYRGQSAILCRNGPTTALFFLGKDYLNSFYPHVEKRSEKLLKDFIAGAVLGASLSAAFHPVNLVKVRMQSKLRGDYQRLWSSFTEILKDNKYQVNSFFRGAHLNFVRAFIAWGITNASFEYFIQFFMD